MTFRFDQIVDGRWNLFWNGEFLGFHKTQSDALHAMVDYEGLVEDG